MVKIIKNDDIDLDIPEMIVDKPLAKHLNDIPLFSLMNRAHFCIFLGRPQSGKTSLLVSFLTTKPKIFRKVFENVIVCMPTNSRKSIKKQIFEQLPQEKLFNELTDQTVDAIYNMILSNRERDEKTLLILDDVAVALKGSRHIEEVLKLMIFNRRHLKLCIWASVQVYNSLPLAIRKVITCGFIFKTSKVEMEQLLKELFQIDKELALDIMNTVYKNPHDWLFIDVEGQNLFKKFDQIIYKEDDEI